MQVLADAFLVFSGCGLRNSFARDPEITSCRICSRFFWPD
jgi:hypothetical protein